MRTPIAISPTPKTSMARNRQEHLNGFIKQLQITRHVAAENMKRAQIK